jgi:hypothetical protein
MYRAAVLILSLLILTGQLAIAQEKSAAGGRLPVIVLIEKNPWLWVVGSDSPTFALYDDGLVVYSINREQADYFSAVLDSSAWSDLIQSTIGDGTLDSIAQETKASNSTDQMNNVLLYSDGKGLRVKSVYGALRTDKTARERTPSPFLRAFDKLTSFHSDDAKPWLPEKIEIMIQEFGGKLEPVSWPQGWPDVNSSESVKRGDLYSLFLESNHFGEYKRLTSSLKKGQPIRISGKNWSSSFRLPFPEERYWMR